MQITLLGGSAGYGESIVLQFSDGQVGIIDSFIDKISNLPAAISFLNQQEISLNQVQFVVLTHYHQDHYTGIAQILLECPQAAFYTSQSIASKSFQFLVAAYSLVEDSGTLFEELTNILRILRSTNRKIRAVSALSQPLLDSKSGYVEALSPNEAALAFLDEQYKGHAHQMTEDQDIRIPIKSNFNYQSVVLLCLAHKRAGILGSDLEHHSGQPEIGWDGIYQSGRIKEKTVEVFKVPHHGSQNGYDEVGWKQILCAEPCLIISPYSKGYKLPQQDMIDTLNKLSTKAYITGSAGTSKLPAKFRKKLGNLNIRRVDKRIGSITTTCPPNSDDVAITLGGQAMKLASFTN